MEAPGDLFRYQQTPLINAERDSPDKKEELTVT
jgi:hypothetical protein